MDKVESAIHDQNPKVLLVKTTTLHFISAHVCPKVCLEAVCLNFRRIISPQDSQTPQLHLMVQQAAIFLETQLIKSIFSSPALLSQWIYGVTCEENRLIWSVKKFDQIGLVKYPDPFLSLHPNGHENKESKCISNRTTQEHVFRKQLHQSSYQLFIPCRLWLQTTLPVIY